MKNLIFDIYNGMDSVNTDVIVAKEKLVSFNLMQYYIKIIKK